MKGGSPGRGSRLSTPYPQLVATRKVPSTANNRECCLARRPQEGQLTKQPPTQLPSVQMPTLAPFWLERVELSPWWSPTARVRHCSQRSPWQALALPPSLWAPPETLQGQSSASPQIPHRQGRLGWGSFCNENRAGRASRAAFALGWAGILGPADPHPTYSQCWGASWVMM